MQRARVTATIAAAGIVTSLGVAPIGAHGASAPLVCQAFGVSPDAQSADSAMCVVADVTRDSQTEEETSRTLKVYASHDGGHSWTSMRALGLPPVPAVDAPPPSTGGGYVEQSGTTPVQVIYSAGYDTNHTVFLATLGPMGGVYQTTDDGDTWTLVNTTSDLNPVFLPYVDPRPAPGNLAFLRYPLAVADRVDPVRLDGPITTKEKGADPAYSRLFAFAARPYRGIQLFDAAEVQNGSTSPPFSSDVATLRSCTLDLDCSTVLHTFPRGSGLMAVVPAGDFDRTGLVLVDELSTSDRQSSLGWLESHDGGRTFRPWSFVARANRDVAHRGGRDLDIAVAVNPHRPGEVVATVLYAIGDVTHQRIYVTRDDGRRWALTSDRTLTANYDWMEQQPILAADGRLYQSAIVPWHSQPEQDAFNPKRAYWCSADTGRTWSATCPR